MQDNVVGVRGTVYAILEDEWGVTETHVTNNIVTNDGDIYYAQLATGTAVTDDFAAATARMRLGTGTTTPTKTDTDLTTIISGAATPIEASFPAVGDASTGNSGGGADIATWKYIFLPAAFSNAAVAEGAIVDAASPTAALCHFLFAAPFAKGSTQTLTIFVNHQFNGI
jgi:hypothetical protein